MCKHVTISTVTQSINGSITVDDYDAFWFMINYLVNVCLKQMANCKGNVFYKVHCSIETALKYRHINICTCMLQKLHVSESYPYYYVVFLCPIGCRTVFCY